MTTAILTLLGERETIVNEMRKDPLTQGKDTWTPFRAIMVLKNLPSLFVPSQESDIFKGKYKFKDV